MYYIHSVLHFNNTLEVYICIHQVYIFSPHPWGLKLHISTLHTAAQIHFFILALVVNTIRWEFFWSFGVGNVGVQHSHHHLEQSFVDNRLPPTSIALVQLLT